MKIELINLKQINDQRGSLVFMEEPTNIPFKIKRIYYIFNNQNNKPRGFHAHKKLNQVAVCIQGSCRILLDDGNNKTAVILDNPAKGLFIKEMVWREMYDFSENCILMVIASRVYEENDYIRDYSVFKDYKRSNI